MTVLAAYNTPADMHVRELFDLTGQVALITGGSRGLGLEIAAALGEAGARVAITARREQWLDGARDDLTARGITCLSTTCDVSRPEEVDACVATTISRFGGLDILVNDAGISWGAPADEMPLEKWHA